MKHIFEGIQNNIQRICTRLGDELKIIKNNQNQSKQISDSFFIKYKNVLKYINLDTFIEINDKIPSIFNLQNLQLLQKDKYLQINKTTSELANDLYISIEKDDKVNIFIKILTSINYNNTYFSHQLEQQIDTIELFFLIEEYKNNIKCSQQLLIKIKDNEFKFEFDIGNILSSYYSQFMKINYTQHNLFFIEYYHHGNYEQFIQHNTKEIDVNEWIYFLEKSLEIFHILNIYKIYNQDVSDKNIFICNASNIITPKVNFIPSKEIKEQKIYIIPAEQLDKVKNIDEIIQLDYAFIYQNLYRTQYYNLQNMLIFLQNFIENNICKITKCSKDSEHMLLNIKKDYSSLKKHQYSEMNSCFYITNNDNILEILGKYFKSSIKINTEIIDPDSNIQRKLQEFNLQHSIVLQKDKLVSIKEVFDVEIKTSIPILNKIINQITNSSKQLDLISNKTKELINTNSSNICDLLLMLDDHQYTTHTIYDKVILYFLTTIVQIYFNSQNIDNILNNNSELLNFKEINFQLIYIRNKMLNEISTSNQKIKTYEIKKLFIAYKITKWDIKTNIGLLNYNMIKFI